MTLEQIPFDLRGVVEDCVKSYVPKAAQKSIDLTFRCGMIEPQTVIGDPLRLRQIVTNLISNAVKFTDRGWVQVLLRIEPAVNGTLEAGIEVRDTGSGIPPEKIGDIFEKFTQADSSITRRYGGTGLGLAITTRLVELTGGRIRVESEVGRGSAFFVTLPYEAAATPTPALPAPVLEPASLTGSAIVRLLLVEDNLVNQKVVLALLRKKGYSIEIANNGKEALQKLESADAPYNLVLMDVQMPVMDGLEATRVLRRDARWEQLPVIALTAHAMTGDREKCLEAGMDGYVSKPIQPEHLIATVERYLCVHS